MNEKNKLYIVLGIVVVVFLSLVMVVAGQSAKGEKILQEVRNKVNDENGNLVYVMSKACSVCTLYKDEIAYIKKNNDFEYYEVDIKDLSTPQLEELLSILKVEGTLDDFGTPYMTYVKGGEVVKAFPDFHSANELFEYLKEMTLIPNEKTLPLTYIDYNEYTNLLNSKNKEVIVIGQTGCGYCTKAIPILDSIVIENNVKINYFNYKSIDNQEDYNSFIGSLPYFQTKWGTPTMLIVQNGELIEALPNLTTKEKYVEFLKKNEIIKE